MPPSEDIAFGEPLQRYTIRRLLVVSADQGVRQRLGGTLLRLQGLDGAEQISGASVETLEEANRYIAEHKPNIVLLDPQIETALSVLDFALRNRSAHDEIVWIVLDRDHWLYANRLVIDRHEFGERIKEWYSLGREAKHRDLIVSLTLCHRDFVLNLLKTAAERIKSDESGVMTREQVHKFVTKAITSVLSLLNAFKRPSNASGRQAFVSLEFENRALYQLAIRPSLEAAGYDPVYMEDRRQPGAIPAAVFAYIGKCSLFVADLSKLKPDVLIEIGAARIIGVPMILFRDTFLDDTSLPFLLKTEGVSTYRDASHLQALLQREIERLGRQ